VTVEPGPVIAAVAHARHVPVVERERFARRLAEPGAPDGLLLETCHRVEVYTVRGADIRELEAMLPPGGELLVGDEAAQHAIAVAVGMDSVVVGEDQLLHQLRTSIAGARRDGRLHPILERLFSLALRSGRRARSWRQGPPRSLADVALAAIQRRIGPLQGRGLLVVGAGEMARLAVGAASSAGAAVSVASRTPAHAEALARRTGVATAPFDPGILAGDLAGAIVALRGPWPIESATVDLLAGGSSVVVDLSVPSALSADVASRLDGRFVSADALAAEEDDPSAGHSRLPELIDATLAEYSDWLAGRRHRATAAALAERADERRQAELDELWRRLPELEPEVREAIERMSRHLAGRLLLEPLERLGRDGDGRAEQAARELFAL
jgi:glutamyl-tRNA reductase